MVWSEQTRIGMGMAVLLLSLGFRGYTQIIKFKFIRVACVSWSELSEGVCGVCV